MGVGYYFKISIRRVFRYISLYQVVGILTFFLINIFLIVGISSQINYYEKKAIDQRVRYTQKQCAVLSNQIVNNGFRNYNMSSLSGESGASIFEVEQLANNLEGGFC